MPKCKEKKALKEPEMVKETAHRVLLENPDPVVRFRLLRDVLVAEPDSDGLVQARQEMLQSRWVRELRSGQKEDGSWGRFHSATKSGGMIATTEAAVERGLALGLVASDPVFQTTIDYLTRLLAGEVEFPDPPERNNRWTTGTQLFAAATLARINPALPMLDKPWKLWTEIAERTFASGKYDQEAEIQAHEELTGASVKDSYLVLSGRYQLALLGSRADKLPKDMENALLDWLWHRQVGIGYLGIPLANPPKRYTTEMLDMLLTSHEILSYFPSWRKHSKTMSDWLWTNRNSEGMWNFGRRASMSTYFPLSESWRRKRYKQHDWTTRTLALLKRFYDA